MQKRKLYHCEQRRLLFSQVPKNGVCAEIGVLYGQGSELILSLAKPKKLHLIDPWLFVDSNPAYRQTNLRRKVYAQREMDQMYQDVLSKFSTLIKQEIIQIHRESSERASETFPDAYFDWIYIDGCHEYSFVKKDLEAYYPKVKKRRFHNR